MKLVNFSGRWGDQISINPDDVSSVTSVHMECSICVISMKNGQNHEVKCDFQTVLIKLGEKQ